jgi:hypothetical protein
MKRYDLLQNLERFYPSPEDWYIITDDDEGVVKVCFVLDKEEQANVSD